MEIFVIIYSKQRNFSILLEYITIYWTERGGRISHWSIEKLSYNFGGRGKEFFPVSSGIQISYVTEWFIPTHMLPRSITNSQFQHSLRNQFHQMTIIFSYTNHNIQSHLFDLVFLRFILYIPDPLSRSLQVSFREKSEIRLKPSLTKVWPIP